MRSVHILIVLLIGSACAKVKTSTLNVIERENSIEGNPDWASGRDVTSQGEVFAYADLSSARDGDIVHVMISSNERRSASWTVYRFGWYSGARARRVAAGGPVKVGPQQSCPIDVDTGMVRCSWQPTLAIPVTRDFVSGLFAIKIIRDDGFVRFLPLVITDDRPVSLLVQAGINTYQAYNSWGGTSLYADTTGTIPRGRAVKVSFDRPYDGDRGLGLMLHWDAPFAAFVERFGYDVSYTTNLDVSFRGVGHVRRAGAFISAGHDEYWSALERDVLDNALASRVSLIFLGANIAYWKIRYEAVSGEANARILVCYRDPQIDPVQDDVTTQFRDPAVSKPENGLLGIMYESIVTVSFPWVVSDGSSWLYEGTGLATGDTIPLLIGFEYDRSFSNGAAPGNVEVLSRSPLVTTYGWPSWAESGAYRSSSGALVFSVGTLLWNRALQPESSAYDPRVLRMTANAFRQAVGLPIPPELESVASHASPSIGPFAHSVTTVVSGLGSPTGLAEAQDGSLIVADPGRHQVLRIAPDASHAVSVIAGDGTAGSRDGVPGEQAQFQTPVSVTVDPAGNIYVADAGNECVRKIGNDPSRTVTSIAGRLGVKGSTDGIGDAARFSSPVAVAVSASGYIFVADKLNHRIRAIDPVTGAVTTLAGSVEGNVDGPGASAQMTFPTALAIANTGAIYVLETYFTAVNEMGYALKIIATDSAHTVHTIAQGVQGFQDGAVPAAKLAPLGGLAVDRGRLFIADGGNLRIRELLEGPLFLFVHTLAGSGRFGNDDGSGESASFGMPLGLMMSQTGLLYVADSANGTIRIIAR